MLLNARAVLCLADWGESLSRTPTCVYSVNPDSFLISQSGLFFSFMDNFFLSTELAPDGKILTQTTEVYIQQPDTNDLYHIIII